MNEQDLAKRNGKANGLKVFQVDNSQYHVESSEGKICYKVFLNNGSSTCTCADFTKNISKIPNFTCKHILAVANRNGNSSKVNFLEMEKPKLDERFLVNIKGKDFVVYAGLLDLAHQIGFRKMKPEVVQYPSKDNGNNAICTAYLLSKDGQEFWDVGDANPNNVSFKVRGHELRMASTRAKARILRDFTNVGITCLEEIGDLNEVLTDDKNNSKPPRKRGNKHKKETTPVKAETPKDETSKSDKPELSIAQKKAIENLANRRGISQEELEEKAKEQFNKPLEALTSSEAATFIRSLQQSN